MKNLSQIFKNAHKIARTLEGDYKACFSEGLRIAYANAKDTSIDLVVRVVDRMNKIEPASNARAVGGRIKGYYRGKGSESYSYMLTARAFEYNNAHRNVSNALNQAIWEVYA